MYKPTWTMEAYLNGSWVDITDDVLGVVRAEWGMGGSGPTDLVADVGELSFDLQNHNPVGKYSPGHPNCTSGWKKGVAVRHSITYNGKTKRYRAYVDDVQNAGGKDERKRITAVDWLEYAARNPIKNPGILENKRGDQVLTDTLALMPIPPQSTNFDIGINTFPTAFDTVTSKTKAINEFVKTALSEIGRVYLIKDATYGETLVFENAHARNGLRTLTEFEKHIYSSGFLKKADNGFLLKSDGGKLIYQVNTSLTTTLHLDNDPSVLDYEIEDGENILNRFTCYAVPRKVDTSAQVLFRLNAPISIASGQTITIRGTYANPDGGLPINANPDDMITPAATTDYRAFVNSNGTGTEFTASLTVTPSYGTEGFAHTVYNASASSGYVTLFNCRGYGIYTYNPIEHQANDSDSQDEFGIISDAITQKYKNDLAYGTIYVDMVVDDEKEPRTVIKRIYLNANKDADIMLAFLQLDVGSLIRVTEDKSNVDSYYFIQGVSYQTRPGGILMFDWIIKPFLCLALGMSQLAVEFRGGTTTDAVNFGILEHTNDLTTQSYSFWVYLDVFPTGTGSSNLDVIYYRYYPPTAFFIALYDSKMRIGHEFSTAAGIWETNANPFATGGWHHIVFTYNNSSTSNDPIIYIDGASVTVNELAAPVGTAVNKPDAITYLGNVTSSSGINQYALDGKLKDFRVYDRILSGAEVTTLYNSGTPDMDLVTDGLKFQAFVVPTFRLGNYTDTTLTSDMKVRDRIYGVVGTPNGSPIGRNP